MKEGGRVMPKGERAKEKKYTVEEDAEDSGRERESAAARLIAVDLHDKRSRQLVTKVALRH